MDCERPSLKKFAKLSLHRDMQPRAIRSRSWLDLGFRLGIPVDENQEETQALYRKLADEIEVDDSVLR